MWSNGFDHSVKDDGEETVSCNGQEVNSYMVKVHEADKAVPIKYSSSNEQADGKFFREAENQESCSGLQSSDVGVSGQEEVMVNSTTQRALCHCITAPAAPAVHTHTLINETNPVLLRSLTEKPSSPRPDMILERLSEREKKKFIVELVKIQNDGTVEVDLEKNPPVASELLEFRSVDGASVDRSYSSFCDVHKTIPKLKIAILVVGTRGDVQPFVAIAKRLQEFGHRVRLATHTNFSGFVKSAGIEFYPLGGDPRVLAGYMARNKGLIPSGPGEISIQRKELKAIIESLLPACIEPDLETGAHFRAQAIIANPPAYGHAHVAEALGVPLHIFFTMPWTPTYEFPHPLARVPQSAGYWLSYMVVDLLIWWTIRSYINDFRKRKLKLPPIAYLSMYNGSISHFPTGYMWSPHLVPKPQGGNLNEDWGPSVDVVGYCFLNLGAKYQPQEEFAKWIQKGPPPIYIGFGSMPLDDARKTTGIILDALKDTGQRGIVDRGWGNLGNITEIPENIFLLEECPHDWLFPHCYAVVHHGGAGTTAAGLKAGCPTTVVPFFGDQFFWADRLYEKGLGPAPIPISELSVENLSGAIKFMLEPEVKTRAMELSKLIGNEDGVAAAVDAFHRHLPPELPLPGASTDEDDDNDHHPNPIDQFFLQIGKLCCLPCST